MARKRHHADQELPFVALMDTMTNVVGVLTIVLVMIGISLAAAVSKVISSLPPATPEQVQAAQKELEELKKLQEPDVNKLKQLDKPDLAKTQLAALDTEIARLEATAKDKNIKLFDSSALDQERKKREDELKLKKEALDKLMAERDRLKALLDATPTFKVPPPKEVRIPASRPIPDGAIIERVVMTTNGAHWIDMAGAKEIFLREFKSSPIRETIHSKAKRGDQTVTIYDHQKLAKYFETRKVPFREFRMDVTYSGWTASPLLRMTPVAKPALDLSTLLRRFKSSPKTVVLFSVVPSAFDQYLAAREVCDAIGVPAGWEYAGSPQYAFAVGEIETNRAKDPPKPVAPNAPTDIKPPSRKLD